MIAPVDERPRAGRERERDPGARARAEFDEFVPPRAPHQFDRVLREDLADINFLHRRHRLHKFVHRRHGRLVHEIERSLGHRALFLPAQAQSQIAAHDFLLLADTRIMQPMAKKEAVKLRLGQLECAALLDRILRRDHEERRGQRQRAIADRDAAFLHRFEQRALNFRRGAVDFIGEQQVRENRPLMRAKFTLRLIENLRADDVRRQQVDGELHAAELHVDRAGEAIDEQRFRQPRHPLQKQMSAREQRDEQPLDHRILPDDHLRHALTHRIDEPNRGESVHGAGRLPDAAMRRKSESERWMARSAAPWQLPRESAYFSR